MAIEDAGAFSQATSILVSEFDSYRSDPDRFRKLIAALAQFKQLLGDRLNDIESTSPTQNTWSSIQSIIVGLEKRSPALTGY